MTRGGQKDRGEVICINYFGNNVPQKIDIRYNMTQGVTGEKTPITPEQKEWIYDELLKAINLASTITIDNMQKKGYSKQLTPNNQ